MPASREGFNLLNKYQRQNFFLRGLFGDNWAREYVLKDTFRFLYKLTCNLIGHSKVFKTDWENGERWLVCYRCLQRIGTEAESDLK